MRDTGSLTRSINYLIDQKKKNKKKTKNTKIKTKVTTTCRKTGQDLSQPCPASGLRSCLCSGARTATLAAWMLPGLWTVYNP